MTISADYKPIFLEVCAHGVISKEDPLHNLFRWISSDFYSLCSLLYNGNSSLGLNNKYFWLTHFWWPRYLQRQTGRPDFLKIEESSNIREKWKRCLNCFCWRAWTLQSGPWISYKQRKAYHLSPFCTCCPLLWAILACSHLGIKGGQEWSIISFWQGTE
jgi:hypothetical protein